MTEPHVERVREYFQYDVLLSLLVKLSLWWWVVAIVKCAMTSPIFS